jgi:hypothetical protein
LARLTRQLGMPALEQAWQQATRYGSPCANKTSAWPPAGERITEVIAAEITRQDNLPR